MIVGLIGDKCKLNSGRDTLKTYPGKRTYGFTAYHFSQKRMEKAFKEMNENGDDQLLKHLIQIPIADIKEKGNLYLKRILASSKGRIPTVYMNIRKIKPKNINHNEF